MLMKIFRKYNTFMFSFMLNSLSDILIGVAGIA